MARALQILESHRAVLFRAPEAPRDWVPSPLTDAKGRAYTYLRLSVTDRCDLACVYCMPPAGEEEHALRPELLTFEEITRIVAVFRALGVRRVRFTGGEPLVRKDVLRLVEMVHRQSSDVELVLTTNATRLAELAAPLRAAGLSGVNVSIDTLDPAKFAEVTRGGDLASVLAGIRASVDAGLEVKLNSVLLRGVNDEELDDLVRFAWSIGATPRFIELMPLGEAKNLPQSTFLSVHEAMERLGGRGDMRSDLGRGPARYLALEGGRVGFITAMSESFCEACNRVRLTALGEIRACLASRRAISLRDVMRAGASDRDLMWAAQWALSAKDEGHRFLDAEEREHESVGMSLVGG